MDVLLDTGLWAMVAGASFLLIILAGAAGSLLEPRLKGDPRAYKKAGLAMMALMLALMLALALSLIPLIVVSVSGFQEVIGNRDVPAVGFLLDHRGELIIAFWAVMLAGSLIAIPAMMKDLLAGRL